MNVVDKLYGKVHINKEFIRNCTILRIGSSIVGESLLKVGAILGQKAAKDKEIPWLVKKGTKEMKAYYLKAVFDDESSVYKNKNKNNGYLVLSRYRHLKDLTRKQEKELKRVESFMSVGKFPTGHIRKTIPIKRSFKFIEDKDLIEKLRRPPKLLQGESKLLNEFEINHRLFGRCLTKTHKGKYSICFDLFINQKDSLTKFYKYIGYSLVRKQKKLISLVGGTDANKTLQHINKEERDI
ncbi:MAG: hypothetical protein KKA62_03295 [Nanoarchaeota archaeon]|nr:hypothetical protein [Nanoarchaeota archaeon]MBU1643947.1 hypothetical protein [Nanoarchaeota archaeon]MBU1976950.1 hypothetical protein [Nanoarchaeota archaeon]